MRPCALKDLGLTLGTILRMRGSALGIGKKTMKMSGRDEKLGF